MLAHAFAARNLERWEGKIGEKVGGLVMQLDRRCMGCLGEGGVTVDFRVWLNLFTVDAVADLALSERLGFLGLGMDRVAIEGGDGVRYIDSLHCGGRFVSAFVGATDWFHFLKTASIWLSPYLRSQWERGQNFGRIVRALVDKRLQRSESGEHLDDFFDCLITDKSGNARYLDRGEIEAETGILCELVFAKVIVYTVMLILSCSGCRLRYHRNRLDTCLILPHQEPTLFGNTQGGSS